MILAGAVIWGQDTCTEKPKVSFVCGMSDITAQQLS